MERGNLPQRLRILIVDDSQDAANSMMTLCRLLKHDALAVENGLAAVEVAKQYLPDVTIMDLSMPRLDGYAAARLIRQQEALANTVLVAWSGWSSPEGKQKAMEAGFDHYWVKPVSFEALRSLLEAASRRPTRLVVAESDQGPSATDLA